jgi:hypothetical protein
VITVVTWIWHDPGHGGGRRFEPGHVNVLARMLARHMGVPHKLVCFADVTDGFSSEIEVRPTPPEAAQAARLRSPEGSRFPSCYRRLWAFSAAAREIGDRLLVIDVDLVVTGSLAHLFDRPEPFIGWRPRMTWGGRDRVAGGMYLLTAGAHLEVWEEFGEMGVLLARRAGYRGSDQAWMSYKLGATAATWPEGSGLYSIRDLGNGRLPLPADARLVQFNGPMKPWQAVGDRVTLPPLERQFVERQPRLAAQAISPNLGWVRRHWR